MQRFVYWTVVLLSAAFHLERAALADTVYISGTTVGSHFAATGAFAVADETASVLHLAFNAASFASQDSSAPLSLGSFTLGRTAASSSCSPYAPRGACSDDYRPYTFDLTLSLGIPVGNSIIPVNGQASGQLYGKVSQDNPTKTVSGTVGILFPAAPTVFSFHTSQASGSFRVTVDDVFDVAPGQTAPLYATVSDFQIAAVPEPGSLMSLVFTLLGAAVALKPRKHP